jgi:hypothetical protein
MSVPNPPEERAAHTVTLTIAPERAAQLDCLAADVEHSVTELARESLEAEIEAQSGLRYGPSLRKHLYR